MVGGERDRLSLLHGYMPKEYDMDIGEALDYLDSRFCDYDIAAKDDSRVYALGYDINHTPAMWNHADHEVPGVVFCPLHDNCILITDLDREYEYLLRQDEEADGTPKYFLQGINYDLSYTQSEVWAKEVEAIACVADYACRAKYA